MKKSVCKKCKDKSGIVHTPDGDICVFCDIIALSDTQQNDKSDINEN